MKIEVPYNGKTKEIEIDEERLLWVLSPNNPPGEGTDAVENALNEPIKSDPLGKLAQEAGNCVILVDDNTRPTPQRKILSIVLNRLNENGLKDEDIKIIVGLGTHRKMTPEEVEERFGVSDRIEIVNHESEDENELVQVEGDNGHTLYINREYHEADLSISIGSILPHVLTGWSGGSKMIQPGVSGEKTTGYTHMMAIRKGVGRSLGKGTNPIRKEIDKIALKTGLDFILNVILNLDGEIYEAVAGHPVEAFKKGVEYAKEVYSVEVPEIPDVVVANSYPNERDLWQGQKAINDAYVLTEGESDIVFLSPCLEGISEQHPIMIERAGDSLMQILEDVEEGKIEDEVGTSGLLSLQTLKSGVECTFVTEGISKSEVEKMGFKYAKTVEDALEEEDGSVGVLTHAGEIAPKL